MIEEDDLLATVMEKVPSNYSAILAAETRIQADDLEMKDLEDATDTEYRFRYKTRESDFKKKGLSLTASEKLSGKCYTYGEVWYRATDCSNKGSNHGRTRHMGTNMGFF